MDRYGTRVVDGVLFVEGQDGWISVGEFDEIIEELGGETYEIEYEEPVASMPWLDTEDGVLALDLRDRLPNLDFKEEFVGILANTPEDQRVGVYVEVLQAILDPEEEL